MSKLSSSPLSPFVVARVAVATVAAGGAAAAQNYEVSDLSLRAAGTVETFVLQAGERVVYTDSPNTLAKLWSVPIDRSAPRVLLHQELTEGPISGVAVTADGAWTLYRDVDVHVRLLARPTDGSAAAHELSGEMTFYGGVADFRTSPDSARVVYRADAETDEVFGLWSSPVDASTPPVRLSGNLAPGGDVMTDYRFSPDGQWVVYRADQGANDVFDLYAVPTDGSAPAHRLNASHPLADVQGDFVVAFDSFGVVYRADQDTDEVLELYAVRIDGLFASVKRSGPLVAGGDVRDFRLSQVDDRLVYRADQAVDERIDLYSVRAITGGTPVKLDGSLPAAGDVSDFQISPTAARVLYRADQDTDGVQELYSAPANGASPAVKLHPSLSPGRGVAALYRPSPDGLRVVFAADLELAGAKDLHSAPCDGSAAPLRLTEFDPGTEVQSLSFDSSGACVVYLADANAAGVAELFSVPANGAQAPAHLNRTIATGGGVLEARVTDDDAYVVYAARQRRGYEVELFRVPLAGDAEPVLLSYPFPRNLAAAGDVQRFELSPDGRDVFYLTYGGGLADTWRVALDGPPESTRVSGPGGDEFMHALSADGRYAVFERPARTGDSDDVIARRVDGSTPAVWLDRDVPIVAYDGGVYDVAITPDSTRALFTMSQEIQDEISLYSAPLDGGAPAVRIDEYIAARPIVISPDSARAVYLRSGPGTPVELFSAPTDGSQAPTRLNAALPAGGSIGASSSTTFAITPDCSRVVYVGEQDTAGVLELYSVPIAGGAPPVKLNGTLVAGGTVGGAYENLGYVHDSLAISPDGQWVVYMADATTDQQTEVYAVRLDGSAPPVRISAAMPAGADVFDFRIDPTSRRVVHRSFGDSYFFYDLHSAPIDGSSPAVLLSHRAEFWDYARGYDVTPDGERVLFAARLDDSNTVELYLRAIDAGTPPVKLNGPLAAGGDVYTFNGPEFLLTPSGDRVLYMADQDQNDVVEIFATFLGRPTRRRGLNH